MEQVFGSLFSVSWFTPQTLVVRPQAPPHMVICDEEELSPTLLKSLPLPVLLLISLACLVGAAIAAGLTLGIMSLDTLQLQVVERSGTTETKRRAALIKPLREKGNQLLVTLLLTNSICAELLPLVVDAILPGGVLSLIISVLSIMLFSEVIPQAVCSRHGLQIGAYFAGFVNVLLKIMFPVAFPIAWCLDKFLGHEMGQIYTRDELKGLVDAHARSKYGMLSYDEATILHATLDFALKTVAGCMTHAEHCFMLEMDEMLNHETMKTILRSGHSRVPLYEKRKSNVVALLLTKQLLLVDPQDNVPIRALVRDPQQAASAKLRICGVLVCNADTPLMDMLNEFQRGRGHMAIVYDNILLPEKKRKFLGLITLEDILEELLQEEIVDETDVYVSNDLQSMPVYRRGPDGKLYRTLTREKELDELMLRYRDIDHDAIVEERKKFAKKEHNKDKDGDKFLRPGLPESLRSLEKVDDKEEDESNGQLQLDSASRSQKTIVGFDSAQDIMAGVSAEGDEAKQRLAQQIDADINDDFDDDEIIAGDTSQGSADASSEQCTLQRVKTNDDVYLVEQQSFKGRTLSVHHSINEEMSLHLQLSQASILDDTRLSDEPTSAPVDLDYHDSEYEDAGEQYVSADRGV